MFAPSAEDLSTDAGQDDEPPWARGLNQAQRSAVCHGDDPLLIIAGAGTGKTRTLAHRVARLIDDGASPDRILLLTFTRRAAAEMTSRVGGLLDASAARHLWSGTFHSVANRLLRCFSANAGLSPDFTVMDPADAADLLGALRSQLDLPVTQKRFPRKETTLAIWSRLVNRQMPLSDILENDFPWCSAHEDALRELFIAYTDRKRSLRVLDFDDLLLHARALAAAPDAGAGVRAKFDHVLVDEYQDTNALQVDFVEALLSNGHGLTVVGDDAQAIYGFRGAEVTHLWEFTDRFEGASRVVLDENYRSTTEILAVANEVVAASETLLPKQLRAVRGDGVTPVLVTCDDEADEAVAVCDRILDLREQDVDLRDQAVLFRAGHHSEALELELARRDIPFVKYGGLAYLESAHVKDLVAMLRLAENPLDELAWHRTLSLFPGVGPVRLRLLLDHLGFGSDTEEIEPAAVRAALGDDEIWSPKVSLEAFAMFQTALAHCWSMPAPPVAEQIEQFVDVCELLFVHRYDNATDRLADLTHLARTADDRPRNEFLTELTLEPPSATSELAGAPHLDDDWLTLSTVHSAKGAEWSAVHLIHAADGNFPSDMALTDADGLEEERRLLYVALTRAKDTLAVSFPLRYHVTKSLSDRRHVYAQLSRFIDPLTDRFEPLVTEAHDTQTTISETSSVTTTDEVENFVHGLLSR
ncbi:MAG: ATP-dependent helicase [Acidobacteria bacterium]|nr:ATP-dependent helicase [Acidobacteriota bacterium]